MTSSCFNLSSPNHTISVKGTCNGVELDVVLTLQDLIPKGPTSSRPPHPVEPSLRYNTTAHNFEYWNGSIWTPISGGGGSSSITQRFIYKVGNPAILIKDTEDYDFMVENTDTLLIPSGYTIFKIEREDLLLQPTSYIVAIDGSSFTVDVPFENENVYVYAIIQGVPPVPTTGILVLANTGDNLILSNTGNGLILN